MGCGVEYKELKIKNLFQHFSFSLSTCFCSCSCSCYRCRCCCCCWSRLLNILFVCLNCQWQQQQQQQWRNRKEHETYIRHVVYGGNMGFEVRIVYVCLCTTRIQKRYMMALHWKAKRLKVCKTCDKKSRIWTQKRKQILKKDQKKSKKH